MFIRYIVHCHVPNPVGTLRKFVHCAMYNVPTFARGGLQCTNVPTLRASVLQRFLIPVESLWEELKLFVHCSSRFGTLPCTMYQLLRRAHWAFSGLKENVRGTPCAVGTLFASQCTMYQRTNVRTFARQALKCTNVRTFSKRPHYLHFLVPQVGAILAQAILACCSSSSQRFGYPSGIVSNAVPWT